MEIFERDFLCQFRKELQLIVDKSLSSNELIVIRGTANTAEDVSCFFENLRSVTHTEWLSYKEIKNPEKFIYHRTWLCQHSSRNKTKSDSLRNAKCPATLDIKIKKVNRNTKRNDLFLQRDPPLPCVVKLSLSHSHDTNTAASLRMLRVDNEVQMRFFQYFFLDMRPTESQHYHQQILLQNATPEVLADASKNPTLRQISYLYNIWRNENLGHMDPLNKIAEKISLYEERVKMMKSKWRHLRDNYLRSIKVDKGGSNRKRYVYAEQLNFLHDTFGSRAASHKKSTGSNELMDLASKIQNDQQNAYTNGHSGSEIRSDNYEANESCSSDAIDDTYQPPSKKGHYTKLPIVSPKPPTIRPKLPTLEPTIPTTKHVEASQIQEEDADLMFFNSILPDYKELDEEEKLDFRIKCLQFIRDTRKSRKS